MKRRAGKRARSSQAAKLVMEMSALERRALRVLAEELDVDDAALAHYVARAMAAARLLHGQAKAGHGDLVTAYKSGDASQPPMLFVERRAAAKVVDLTAYRLERAAQGR